MSKSVPALKRTAEFKDIFDKGQKTHSPRISLYFKFAREIKIAISISKKQEKKAVLRNRSRRLIREFFRLNQDKIKEAHIIVVAREPLVKNYDETSQIMLKLLRKVGLIK